MELYTTFISFSTRNCLYESVKPATEMVAQANKGCVSGSRGCNVISALFPLNLVTWHKCKSAAQVKSNGIYNGSEISAYD